MSKLKKPGGTVCCVPGCNNNTVRNRDVSWHYFPKDPNLKAIWVKRVNRQGSKGKFSLWNPNPHSRICGSHFNDFGKKRYENRVPRIFPWKTYSVDPTLSMSRPRKGVLAQPFTTDECPSSPVFLNMDVAAFQDCPEVHMTSPTEPSLVASSMDVLHNSACRDHDYGYPENSLHEAHRLLCQRVEFLEEHNSCLEMEVKNLKEKFMEALNKVKQLEKKCAEQQKNLLEVGKLSSFSMERVLEDKEQLLFYTGFDSQQRFLVFFKFVQRGYKSHLETKKKQEGRPRSLSLQDELLLVMSRLRVGLLEEDLGYRFKISVSTVSRIWTFWVDFLAAYLSQVPCWPSRALVDAYMPDCFRQDYPTTRVILDCTEIFIETPSDFRTQSDTYSAYKSHNTAKGLIGITPNGFVAFVSDLAPGRISDKVLTQSCGIYKLLEAGDSVMADRGFTIQEELEEIAVQLNIPPFMRGRTQLSTGDELLTRRIAKLRIHVERVIGQVKNFRILKFVFPNSMHERLNSVWRICALLCNFTNEPLVDRNAA